MALSEREKQLLAEMERNFYQSEADVVNTATKRAPLSYRNIVVGAVIALSGVGLLIAGQANSLVWLGILGFVVMVAGIVFGSTPGKADPDAPAARAPKQSGQGSGGRGNKNGSFEQRLSERWEQRMNGER